MMGSLMLLWRSAVTRRWIDSLGESTSVLFNPLAEQARPRTSSASEARGPVNRDAGEPDRLTANLIRGPAIGVRLNLAVMSENQTRQNIRSDRPFSEIVRGTKYKSLSTSPITGSTLTLLTGDNTTRHVVD